MWPYWFQAMFTIFPLYWDSLLLFFWYCLFEHYQVSCIPLCLRLSSQQTVLHSSKPVEVCFSLPPPFLWSPLSSFSWSLFPSSAALWSLPLSLSFTFQSLSFSLLESNLNAHLHPTVLMDFSLENRLVTITENLDCWCLIVLLWVTKILQERWYFFYLPRKDSSIFFFLDDPFLPTFPRARDLEQGFTFLLFLSFKPSLLLWNTVLLPFFSCYSIENIYIAFPIFFYFVALFLITSL